MRTAVERVRHGMFSVYLIAAPAGVDLNSPLHAWFEDLRAPDTGILCCSEADCRPVQYRITGDHYEVFIDRKSFGESAPDRWLPAPDKVVLHRHDNPTGEAIACYYAGEIHCFIEASGT